MLRYLLLWDLDNWVPVSATIDYTTSVESFKETLVHKARSIGFEKIRLVEATDSGVRILCEASRKDIETPWHFEEWCRDEAVFMAAMALTEDPMRKKALLMQRIANLVQT